MPGAKTETLSEIERRLEERYPNARYELEFQTPLELLVATILAARCTDERVNQVTRTLFERYRDAEAYANADVEELEAIIRPTGSYHNKAKAIMGAARALCERFDGEPPKTMDELLTLPGVARKTANVVLNMAFDIPSGIIVDSHVARVSQRMGLTRQDKPEEIESELMKLLPREQWIQFGAALVLFGRYTCKAKAPGCDDCPMADLCPKVGVSK